VFVTVAWVPLMFLLCRDNKALGMGLASGSPLFGVGLFTNQIAQAKPEEWPGRVAWSLFWILVFGVAALALLRATLATFDSCLGRISDGIVDRGGGRFRSAPSSTSNPNLRATADRPSEDCPDMSQFAGHDPFE
jgi:hypothetical protein